jgi:VacB/RNase II family 3'-5' exoribonuclease
MIGRMSQDHSTRLQAIARRAMVQYGLEPDWPAEADAELAHLGAPDGKGLRDLRDLPWSSIDNDDSRDLDQLEVCVTKGGTRLLIAIADVDALVVKGSALDGHARANTTSVYTPARIFAMLPPQLSTDLTSLNQDQDRPALVVDMAIGADGVVTGSDVYRAMVRNHAKLTYDGVGAWLEQGGPMPQAIEAVPGLEDQIRVQDRLATQLAARREEEGALDFDRTEVKPVLANGTVTELRTDGPNRARDMIENFMVAANGVTAKFLSAHDIPSIRRVVRSPERWSRIVDLARQHGTTLPDAPDARALEAFLRARRAAAPADFADLSLSVIKLLGRGEYVAEAPADQSSLHFALAVSNYTHSTAPNRRFPDLVTQRLVKAALGQRPAPYALPELAALAEHCTKQEDAANKVERLVRKAAAALWMSNRIGEEFNAVVTGASAKGTWVRIEKPPVEGKLERGAEGLDVGDRLRVRLLSTEPERGFIDFGRVGG